jgi:hypothetical protein
MLSSGIGSSFSLSARFPAIPLLVPLGYYVGIPWLARAFVFIGIPLLDTYLQVLTEREPRFAVAWLRNIPLLYVFLWLPALAWAAHTLASEATRPSAAWLLVSAAVATAFATCCAHELLYWPSAVDRGWRGSSWRPLRTARFRSSICTKCAWPGPAKRGFDIVTICSPFGQPIPVHSPPATLPASRPGRAGF